MPRPTVASEADIRGAIVALWNSAHSGARPRSPQAFRRAVSVRRVRDHLGGGNPATIGQIINAVEAELDATSNDEMPLPKLPPPIAELMETLWRVAVDIKLDEVEQLRAKAQAVSEAAVAQLSEAGFRSEVLKQEITELRSAMMDRDERLAQASSELDAAREQLTSLKSALDGAQQREADLAAAQQALRESAAAAVATAQARHDGLSQHLLEETAQQRQAAQAEIGRMTSQLKFADKRQAALEGRVEQLTGELVSVRADKEHAMGEISALRYVNTTLQAQLQELQRAQPVTKVRRPLAPMQAQARKRASGSARSKPITAPK